jgi:hypothetical protein
MGTRAKIKIVNREQSQYMGTKENCSLQVHWMSFLEDMM